MSLKKYKIIEGQSPIQHFPNNIGRVDLREQTDEFVTEHKDILSHIVEEVKTTAPVADKKT